MGINWGIALGSAAQSGLNTYSKLNEEIRLAEEAERRKQEFEWKAQEQREQQKLREAYKETYGNIGNQDFTQDIQAQGGVGAQQAKALNVSSGDADFDKAVAESTTNALRGNAGQAPIDVGALKGTAYTDKQAAKDFKAKLAASGVDPLKQMQMSGALRSEQRALEEDAFSERMQERYKQIKEDPVKFVEDNLSVYNDAKSGHFGDGNTAKLVKAEDGSATLEVRNAKGKIVTTQPVNQSTALEALKELAFHEYGMLGGKFKEGAELGLKRDEVGIKADTAKTEKEFKGEGGVYHKVHMASIDAQRGKSPTAIYAEKVNMLAQNLMDSNPTKYKSMAEAKVDAAKMVLKAPPEIKETAGGNYIMGNKVFRIDPKTNKAVEISGFGENPFLAAFANADPNKQNAPKASAIPVQSTGARQMDIAAEKAGWKPMGKGGDMYFKLDSNGEPIHRTGEALAKELGIIY